MPILTVMETLTSLIITKEIYGRVELLSLSIGVLLKMTNMIKKVAVTFRLPDVSWMSFLRGKRRRRHEFNPRAIYAFIIIRY